MNTTDPQGILFVCLGNICRSPTAEAVARKLFAEAGRTVSVASCGTGDWHIGGPADARAVAAAKAAGYDLSAHRARQVEVADFDRYRWVLAMDCANLADLQRLCPPGRKDRVRLFLELAGLPVPHEVPDPYHGSAADFAATITLLERGIRGLITQLDAA